MMSVSEVGPQQGHGGQQGQPVRCRCNKLVFMRYGDVIEIKCNKCKRMVLIYTRGIERIEFR